MNLKKFWRKLQRYVKFQYYKLLRAKGGAAVIAMGFAVGLFVEMFNLPTYGTSFLLIFPLNFVLRGSLAAALVGFVFGKLIYVPMSFLNTYVASSVLPDDFSVQLSFLPGWINHALLLNLKLIVGGVIDGAALAFLLYFPIRYSVNAFKRKRKENRRLRRAAIGS
ncbi:DUF2062 domain-containing protein [Cohnella thailandensis]|uniref:DUF2062 domain-containing protein n=1 Tax=Cohnella thailandensis TaxID=557557 RepID=A0A841SRC1_9BACL|nr:DUF2062 domain-containing protein [Cohnella thailandensis]MBB6633752.1 DUF2062 domain-containing protein [Cohnella thailandensis]MBP1976540.1 uncharacterized protein (DUF2062 family) [Cohnella thailandensis]